MVFAAQKNNYGSMILNPIRLDTADKRNKSPIFLGAGVLLGAFKPAFEDIRIFLPRA